jgi:hypothetical protein
MKKALLILVLAAAWMLPAAGCEKDDESRCPQLVAFTSECYRQVVGREPSITEKQQWLDSCETGAHSDACLNCAMQQTCDDYINNHEYVYDYLCADVCP